MIQEVDAGIKTAWIPDAAVFKMEKME